MSIHQLHRPILLTGASGVVGEALLRELSDYPVICLTHRNPTAGGRHQQVKGNLTEPLLGLDPATYRDLASRIGGVVHSAAVTDFGAGAAATNDLNVRGTQGVLEFAAAAQAPLHYVSTAFVARKELSRKATGGTDLTATAGPDDYLDSKRAAEQIVRDAGQPGTILRPSVVIGDSVTGQMKRFQGLHSIAGAIMKNALPMVPLDSDARVDFVPQDLVARVIAGVVRSGTTHGEYWITAGQRALEAGQMVELAVAVGGSLGLSIDAPRLVSPEMVERLIRPVFIDPLPEKARRQFDDLLAMAALFCTATPFDSSLEELPGVQPITTEDLETAFAASMRFYAETKRLVGRAVAA